MSKGLLCDELDSKPRAVQLFASLALVASCHASPTGESTQSDMDAGAQEANRFAPCAWPFFLLSLLAGAHS